jgi:enoyl-CoA hydratase/carnithine racemase
MTLAFENIKKSLYNKDLKQSLFNEYRVSMAFWDHPEFKEGVRARLIDKD